MEALCLRTSSTTTDVHTVGAGDEEMMCVHLLFDKPINKDKQLMMSLKLCPSERPRASVYLAFF